MNSAKNKLMELKQSLVANQEKAKMEVATTGKILSQAEKDITLACARVYEVDPMAGHIVFFKGSDGTVNLYVTVSGLRANHEARVRLGQADKIVGIEFATEQLSSGGYNAKCTVSFRDRETKDIITFADEMSATPENWKAATSRDGNRTQFANFFKEMAKTRAFRRVMKFASPLSPLDYKGAYEKLLESDVRVVDAEVGDVVETEQQVLSPPVSSRNDTDSQFDEIITTIKSAGNIESLDKIVDRNRDFLEKLSEEKIATITSIVDEKTKSFEPKKIIEKDPFDGDIENDTLPEEWSKWILRINNFRDPNEASNWWTKHKEEVKSKLSQAQSQELYEMIIQKSSELKKNKNTQDKKEVSNVEKSVEKLF